MTWIGIVSTLLKPIYIPTFTYGHLKNYVVNKGISTEFPLQGVRAPPQRSLVICEELREEPLVPCITRNQLRWLRHLVRLPSGRVLGMPNLEVERAGGPKAEQDRLEGLCVLVGLGEKERAA